MEFPDNTRNFVEEPGTMLLFFLIFVYFVLNVSHLYKLNLQFLIQTINIHIFFGINLFFCLSSAMFKQIKHKDYTENTQKITRFFVNNLLTVLFIQFVC